jgi:ubiquinone/menaquinone biosynthesis C-methylase UbiE
MHEEEYERLRRVEDHYWWHQALRSLVIRELRAQLGDSARILDVGCGTGGMLNEIQRVHPQWVCHGVDVSPTAVAHCRSRGLTDVILADVGELPYSAAEFDAVLCLDVLYHEAVVEDLAVAEIRRVLKPGGCLLINLPAFETLRGAHDAVVCGARRYTADQVMKMLQSGRVTVKRIHYWNAWLFLPLLIWRHWSRVRRNQCSDMQSLPGWLNQIMTTCGKADARLSRALKIPFGSSLFALAIKR